jgi:hypothetical protein
MKYLQWMIIAGFIALLYYKTHPAIKKAWRRINKKKVAHHRMLAAVRRREVGLSRILELPPEKQKELLHQLDQSWKHLLEKWQSHAVFGGGFTFSEKGLSQHAERDWSVLAFFDVGSYDDYMHCQACLEDDEFLSLRNHYDIRLAIGKRWVQPPESLAGLF